MIDFDREEFLQRLDLRISVISAVLANHEKYMFMNFAQKDFRRAEKQIENIHNDLISQLHEIDERIVKHYDEIKENEQ